MSKKRRRGGVPRMKVGTKTKCDFRRCVSCSRRYKGAVKDAKTGEVERVLNCEDSCDYFARITG